MKNLARKLPATPIQIEAEICRRSLYDFVVRSWSIVEQDPFVDGWHIHTICMYLESLYYGQIESNNLVINVPPRHMKSLLVDVFFPAWVWTKDAHRKFILLSYTEGTIAKIFGKTKKLVKSEWYQERFDVPIEPYPDTSINISNTLGGWMHCYGFGGNVTGDGGDFLLIDDPLKATDADSDLTRTKVNEDYDNAIANRLNNPMTGKRIAIMQRLHERDLVGHLQSKKIKFEHLILPFEYEGERFTSSIGFTDPRTEAGEILWKERFTNAEKLDEYKKSYFDERAKAGQLQQRPSPEGGYIFKRNWFQRINREEVSGDVYISWDTAGSLLGAYSAGIVSVLRPDYTLVPVEVVHKQIEFPQLQEEIEELAKKYQHRLKAVIIEYKSSGIQAVQTLKQQSPQWLADKVMAFNPKGAKDARQYQAASFCEKGCVLFLNPSLELKWLPDFEEEIFTVPASPYKDQADAFSQLIWYLRIFLTTGWQARTNNQRQPIKLEGVF